MTNPDLVNSLPTREIILHLLKTKGDMTTKDLTDELGITTMAVRRHIQSLERDNLITSKIQRQSIGRPTTVYCLTEQSVGYFPNKYHSLTLDILTELEEQLGPEAVEKIFESRKNKMIEKYDQSMKAKNISERVETLANIQNENGYMVGLEKISDDEFILKENNCPISHVAMKYKKVCQCELSMFKSLLGDAEVKRMECLADGGQRCTYSIKVKKQLNVLDM